MGGRQKVAVPWTVDSIDTFNQKAIVEFLYPCQRYQLVNQENHEYSVMCEIGSFFIFLFSRLINRFSVYCR